MSVTEPLCVDWSRSASAVWVRVRCIGGVGVAIVRIGFIHDVVKMDMARGISQ